MLYIKKLRLDVVIDFAAEELKKYLRMMMPHENVIRIVYEPEAKDGFRLGLLEDFSLPCETDNTLLDDVVHIDTDSQGGILAGSNTRSILFAVYRYLRLNGCRFLFPGAEGEVIPKKNVEPQKYHKLADHRFRGHSIEGASSLEQILDYIDWHAKEELNSFGSYDIFCYMRNFYLHTLNEANRSPEYMDNDVAETQWRALFEYECEKRGLRLHGGGHSLIAEVMGVDPKDTVLYSQGKEIPEEVIPMLALRNGKRQLYRNKSNVPRIAFTNLCYSQKKVRDRFVERVVARIEASPQVFLSGASLADGARNHCECEECSKKRPADWLIMMLNQVDEELTKKGIDNMVNISFYVDTIFAPAVERIKNPKRFMLTFCPISRNYVEGIDTLDDLPAPIQYVRNAYEVPKTMPQLFALLKEWKKVFDGPVTVFDYHFWRHQYRDPGLASMSRRVYEDVVSYWPTGMAGCMQDGSNKSFFPHGFHGHIYAEALVNRDCDYEAELQDYFSHFYGEDWKVVRKYLEDITNAFDCRYMHGLKSVDPGKGAYYNPAMADSLANVKELAAQMREVIAKHPQLPTRPQSAAWRILLRHTEYCERLAEIMSEKCLGHTKYALEMFEAFKNDFGKYDVELERWLDYFLCFQSLFIMIKQKPEIEL
ncbi:MAG: DUF4838 domain-containing protein [Oscillospiraceae bacterium]|nr:DUF4838 domain-containing protein [Oscillospiraceae bacterium]